MTFKEDSSLLKRRLLSAIPCLIAATAFACSYVGNFYCDNIQFVPELGLNRTDFFRPRPLSYGLWMYKQQRMANQLDGRVIYSEFCSGYPEDMEFDFDWKMARAFSCVGIIVAGFVMLWQFCAPFLLFDALYWRWAMVIFTFIGACQGITLMFLGSAACLDNPMIKLMVPNPNIYPDECSWDWGTRTSLAGTILFFLTVASMLVIPAPGTRPNERKFPMMVWDDNEDEDDEKDDKSVAEKSFMTSDSDDDSVDTFACDEYDYEAELAKKPHVEADLTETERSHTGYDDDDEYDDVTITEVSYKDYEAATKQDRLEV